MHHATLCAAFHKLDASTGCPAMAHPQSGYACRTVILRYMYSGYAYQCNRPYRLISNRGMSVGQANLHRISSHRQCQNYQVLEHPHQACPIGAPRNGCPFDCTATLVAVWHVFFLIRCQTAPTVRSGIRALCRTLVPFESVPRQVRM
jgi:hypothetical protein